MNRLILVSLLLFLSSPVYADDFQDGRDAYNRKDFKAALEKFKSSAEQEDARAQFFLGLMYSRGQGVTQDDKESFRWYRLAAEQGQENALSILGEKYYNGWDVAQDYGEAAKWYRWAVKQGGDAYDQYNLGVMYDKGQGVNQNYVQAHKLYNIAGALGYEKGTKARGLVEKRMTPNQIAEAQRQAREYMTKHSKAMEINRLMTYE